MFVCIRVNMGLECSALRKRFDRYRIIARNITSPLSEIAALKETFCHLPGSTLSKLKNLHSEVFSQVNCGRLLVFVNFAEQLGLTEGEWEQLFEFLVPTLTQIRV